MHFLFIGILVSLFVAETTGFSPGGVVVAGYLALFALQPMWLVGTFAVAVMTWGVVHLAGTLVTALRTPPLRHAPAHRYAVGTGRDAGGTGLVPLGLGDLCHRLDRTRTSVP